ncbi:MAG: 3D domain-containing protein, partial [Clostridiales bacterium]|nr:3D domain-containing protein [Candidatus Cacconaster stercorequi]
HYLDGVTLTAYCNCPECCGQWSGGPTYSGVMPQDGHTIAVDPDVIPLGAWVEINGIQYHAEDTGNDIKGKHIDIYFDSHEAANDFGVKAADVRWYE